MKKRIAALILALTLLMSINVCAYADSTASEAKNGVAVLATLAQFDGETPEMWSYGTCFFVGAGKTAPQYLLTNYHVVADYLDYGRGELVATERGLLKMLLRVYFGSNDYVETYLIDYNEAQDVALLRIASPTEKRSALKLQVPDESLVGDTVYTIGYPGYSDSIIMDPTSTWGLNDSLITKGTVGRLVTQSGAGTRWIQLADTAWNNGNSGGPLVTEKGTVIGLATGTYSDGGAEMYVAANIEPVIVLLQNNGVAFELAGSGIPLWVIIVAAVVAAAVLVVAIVLIIKSVKKTKGKGDSGKKTPGKGPLPQKKYIGKVRSLAAQHHGKSMALDDGQEIKLGRDHNVCQIRYVSGTPGVSSVHCSLKWDASSQEFILTDLKSSYGTFLMNGQKLTPYQPYKLGNGSSFYLADQQNMLQLSVESVE